MEENWDEILARFGVTEEWIEKTAQEFEDGTWEPNWKGPIYAFDPPADLLKLFREAHEKGVTIEEYLKPYEYHPEQMMA